MKDQWKLRNIRLPDLNGVQVRALWEKLAGFSCPEEKGELARLLVDKGKTLDDDHHTWTWT